MSSADNRVASATPARRPFVSDGDDGDTRVCSHCKAVVPVSLFHKKRRVTSALGLWNSCEPCRQDRRDQDRARRAGDQARRNRQTPDRRRSASVASVAEGGIPSDHRRCSRCQQYRPASHFHGVSRSNVQKCQGCRDHQRQRYQERRQEEAAAMRERLPAAFISEYPRRQRLDFGQMNVECPKCHALHWFAEKLSNSPNSRPEFGTCCKNGAVHLEPISDPPPELKELLSSTDEEAKDFRRIIRQYNSALCFTSLSYRADQRLTGGFIPFQIQGQLCHLHGPVDPEDNPTPAGAQVWIYDPDMVTDIQQRRYPRLCGRTLSMLTDMLHQCNPYIGVYRTAREQLLQHEREGTPVDLYFTANMRLIMEKGADRRRENVPLAPEVAAILPDVGPGSHETTSTTPNSLGHIQFQSIKTHIMNPALHSSPPSTQITDTESPLDLKQSKEYLERLGMSPAEADDLLPSNQRESCFVDLADFVDIVEELITTGGYGQMRHYDIKAIKIEWQNRNKELEDQFEDLQNRILSDLLAYLSTKDLSTKKYEHAVKYAADFIQSDGYNYRIRFIINVLPLLLNNPTPTPIQYSTAEDPRTIQTPGSSKKRAPKSKAQPSNVKLRRSARIRRMQEDSKKHTSPPPTRRQNKKGKQGKQGRQVRRRL